MMSVNVSLRSKVQITTIRFCRNLGTQPKPKRRGGEPNSILLLPPRRQRQHEKKLLSSVSDQLERNAETTYATECDGRENIVD